MISTQYTVVTPRGRFVALWDDDEDVPVEYVGSADAIAYVKTCLELRAVSGRRGTILAFESLEPADLYGFCQSKEFGILVLPEADDLVSLLAEADADSHARSEEPLSFS